MEKSIHNKFKFNILCMVCAGIVPLLVTGPFLPDLLVSILSLWFIYYCVRHKMYSVYKNTYFYFFIAFCIVCIISSLLSHNILLSLESSLFYFRIGIFALLISFLIDHNKKILDYFYYSFVVTFFILIMDGYIQYFTGTNIIGYKVQGIRVSSFFRDELILGSYLSRLFPLLFALFVARKKKHISEIYSISVLFILLDVLIFLSGERTSFVFLNLSTLFIIFFIQEHKLLRITVFIISLAIISTLTFNDNRLYDRYIASPIDNMGLGSKSSKKNIFTPTHDATIKTAWNMFLDKPILGHGPKLFRIKCSDLRYMSDPEIICQPHPHNFYLQLLAETGVVGFAFLAGLFIYFGYLMIKQMFTKYLYQRKLLTDYQICLFAGLLITIWPFSPNGNFFGNHLMIFYSLQIGFFKNDI
jgi:O-antigen ligase